MAAYFTAYRIIHRRRKRNSISKKILKDLQNPFSLDEDSFKKKFSLNQEGVQYLKELLEPMMKRSQGYPVGMQILACLQVLTSGSFQNRVGEDQILCVSQATISRSMDSFLEAILEIEHMIIEFPDVSEFIINEQKLYGQSKIPNIIGVIDCISVPIQKPHVTNYALYLNKKREYSINVQLVCQSDLYITDAVVHWPGSSPNSVIWKNSNLRKYLEEHKRMNNSYLLGNNTYPLEPWLLIPYEDCVRSEELIFNDHVYRALTVFQLCAATLRSRFKCIKPGPLFYTPEKCSKIVVACIVLHNLCIKMGITLSEPVDMEDDFLCALDTETDWDDDEENMLRHEAMCIRDQVAKTLIS